MSSKTMHAEPSRSRLFEWILGQEEEHADDLADLLRSFGGETPR